MLLSGFDLLEMLNLTFLGLGSAAMASRDPNAPTPPPPATPSSAAAACLFFLVRLAAGGFGDDDDGSEVRFCFLVAGGGLVLLWGCWWTMVLGCVSGCADDNFFSATGRFHTDDVVNLPSSVKFPHTSSNQNRRCANCAATA